MNAQHGKPAQMSPHYWVGAAFQAAADAERRDYARYAMQRATEEAEKQAASHTVRPGLIRRLISWLAPATRPAGDSLA